MTGGPPRRWDDDGAEEDAEAHRARELARLERWMAEQKLKPLTDALEAAGLIREPGESWAGAVVVPPWWDEIPEPGQRCPWCQRAVAGPCDECRAARDTGADQPAEWARWTRLTPAQRRLEIAAGYLTDPWSGRRCVIYIEWNDVSAEGEIRTSYPAWTGAAPTGIYWGTRRGA